MNRYRAIVFFLLLSLQTMCFAQGQGSWGGGSSFVSILFGVVIYGIVGISSFIFLCIRERVNLIGYSALFGIVAYTIFHYHYCLSEMKLMCANFSELVFLVLFCGVFFGFCIFFVFVIFSFEKPHDKK